MITNVRRVKSSGDIQRYVRYTIAPEKEQNHEDYVFGERTLELEADNIDVGFDIERNRTSHEVTDQIIQWNKDKRVGRKAPASPAVAGVIAFSINDTEQFYSTSRHGVKYLDRKRAIEIAREAIKETMGDDRPIYLALHGDKDHLHVHFVAGIVNSQGQIWDGSTLTNEQGKKIKVRDYRQWEMANEKLEIKYGLERVTHRKAMEHEGEHRQPQVRRPSNAVVHLANKGEIAPSLDLAGRLELAYNGCNKQFDKFLELAEQNGIHIKPNMNTEKVNGLSFSTDEMDNFIKASDLGNKYKWAKLSKELNYDSSRDYQKLAELKATASTTAITERADITASRTNQRIATIADNINTAAEQAASGLNTITDESQRSGQGLGQDSNPSNRPQKANRTIDDEYGRSQPVIEPTQQNSWNNGDGLQQDDRPGRQSRGSRKASTSDELHGLANEYPNNSSSNPGADVLLQGQTTNQVIGASQTDISSGQSTASEGYSARVGEKLNSAKAVIDSMFDGTESDIEQVAEHIQTNYESELTRLAKEFRDAQQRKSQSRSSGYSNDSGLSM